jgi:hypothetical protein
MLIKCFISIFIAVILSACSVSSEDSVTVTDKGGLLEFSGRFVKAKFIRRDGHIYQEYYARKNDSWEKVIESFHAPEAFPEEGAQLYNSSLDPSHRFGVADILQKAETEKISKDEVLIKLSGSRGDDRFEQYVHLGGGDRYFHITVKASLKGNPVQVDYLLSSFTFNLDRPPSFVHTPGLKYDNDDSRQNRFKLLPGKDQVIGDRAYHSPAIVLQEKRLFAALVPDLNAINRYAVLSPDARRTIDIERNQFSVPFVPEKYTMPTGLDLNVKSGITTKPVFTFGFMDNIIAHHIHYQRTNGREMIRTLASGELRYEFDLFAGADTEENQGFRLVTAHQWTRFGHPVFMSTPHLSMPFEEYLRIVDSITLHPSKYKEIDIPLKGYENHGSWLEFELDGLPVGGFRSAIDWWNDVIHNSQFWNNARDASGFWFWGMQLNRPDLVDKAKRIINFCLSAPKNEYGLFATLYNANTRKWGLQFSDPPHGKNEFFLRESDSYDIPTMSKTGAHLLDYYLRCEKDERIINWLKPYADWLIGAINERGAVPSYVTTKMELSPLLLYSAQPAAGMWFLAAMYNATGEEKYRNAAIRIAGYLEKEIIPEAKWIDMEQYYSCGAKPMDFVKDVWQNQPVRGTLANIWACEGFAQLFTATRNTQYLRDGEICLDYLCFAQCSWNPHYIYTAFPFGGFSVDNSDNATYLDARQAETVKPFIWYGKMLGRQDLLERGVAAARSSVVLLNLPAHKENNIYRYTNIYPYGLGPENIDHEGHPQSAMRTSPGWGEGSGVFTGLAEACRELQGGYMDFSKGLKVGVNGIIIENARVSDDSVFLSIKNSLRDLKMPWTRPFEIRLIFDGLDKPAYKVIINDKYKGILENNRPGIKIIDPGSIN